MAMDSFWERVSSLDSQTGGGPGFLWQSQDRWTPWHLHTELTEGHISENQIFPLDAIN